MKLGLEKKVALVTGSAQGMGRATALVLAGYGCDVIVTDIQTEKLEKTAKDIQALGRRSLAVTTDVSNTEQIVTSVKKAIEAFGHIDILVNCAGIVNASLLYELSEEMWDKVMTINAKSVFIYTRAVANHMIDKGIRGKVVSVSSQAAKLGEYGNGAYSCSKAVISTLTQVFGLELAKYGINVNAICPGPTDTQLMQNVFEGRASLVKMTPEEYAKDWVKNVPLGRMAQPEEMGELIAFLCSDKSSYMTGVSITISGGMTII
jgi:NAD(P)-dependent dehydrogenase (short-subunit alcohol dehydrogenase family)